MTKKLFRSQTDEMVAGVCGGIAEYFDIDATIIRLAWVLLTIMGGAGIIAYIICLFVIPKKPIYLASGDDEYIVGAKSLDGNYKEFSEEDFTKKNSNSVTGGIALIIIGAIFLLRRYIWFDMEIVWPLMLILGGVYVVYKKSKKK